VTAAFVFLAFVVVLLLGASIRVVQQYDRGVLFRLGRVRGVLTPGFHLIVPIVDSLRRMSLRIVTMPIQSQGIITKDNVSVDVSAVAYYRVEDPEKAIVVIDNPVAAINQIAQTTMRKVVGQHSLDDILAETDRMNASIMGFLGPLTQVWGIVVERVELKDIQLPESMKRAMARQAEAEREKRAKIIAAEGELMAVDALSQAAALMERHPVTLQLRTLQTLAEIAVDKNSTVVFPAPLMTTIQELGTFLQRESAAAAGEARSVAVGVALDPR
jgi:regulator of protease activity HflC (stomatin/prohibitin superfamily)